MRRSALRFATASSTERPTGAVILLPEESSEELQALRARSYPFVVADPRLELPSGIPAVSAAHRAGAKAATEHPLGLGHRRIAQICGPRGWAATEERVEGFATALAGAGLLPAEEFLVEGDFHSRSGRAAACKLLDLPRPPTAILAANDHMAFGALQAAAERGLAVPDDLSVIGFDDSELARMVTPELTTVRQPRAELGRTAVSMLMRLIEGQRIEALRIELATQLIVRDSTGRAPARR
jgi:LacI family transcriptional regulator, galactose operon repressor